MAVKLHRCPNIWVKVKGHPCWNVQSALDEQGIEYDVVKGPLRRGKREELERKSGQRMYPVIEFEDGSIYREESKQMAEKIRAGFFLYWPKATVLDGLAGRPRLRYERLEVLLEKGLGPLRVERFDVGA